MIGISAGLVAIVVTLPSPPPPPSNVRLDQQAVREYVTTPMPHVSFEIGRTEVTPARRQNSRRATLSGGLALIAAGTGMIVMNSIGLSSGTTIPPGGARDGYLGKPGVVIGTGLVITGGVLLHRATRRP